MSAMRVGRGGGRHLGELAELYVLGALERKRLLRAVLRPRSLVHDDGGNTLLTIVRSYGNRITNAACAA